MANLQAAFHELADIVEHLIGTHVRWNIDLSHTEAVAKLAAARAHAVAEDVATVAEDVQDGNAAKAVDDVVSMVKPNE